MAKGSAEYNAGVKAFQEGKAYSSFPGKRSEPGTEDWVRGWEDANLKKGPAFQNSEMYQVKSNGMDIILMASLEQAKRERDIWNKLHPDDPARIVGKTTGRIYNSFQNGRTKALEAISNRHPILNAVRSGWKDFDL